MEGETRRHVPPELVESRETPFSPEGPAMATGSKPEKATREPYVPRVSPEELARSNREVIELLESWERDGDEQEQCETMEVLRKALGPDRVASSRPLFP